MRPYTDSILNNAFRRKLKFERMLIIIFPPLPTLNFFLRTTAFRKSSIMDNFCSHGVWHQKPWRKLFAEDRYKAQISYSIHCSSNKNFFLYLTLFSSAPGANSSHPTSLNKKRIVCQKRNDHASRKSINVKQVGSLLWKCDSNVH